MARTRQTFTAAFKAKVALEALKGALTTNEIAALYKVHPNQIGLWRKQLVEAAEDVFTRGRTPGEDQRDVLIKTLYQRLGEQSVELEFLKKRC